jgi:sugar O-acyltransferase (sialic acid O-acetyltransferase NeuD family)
MNSFIFGASGFAKEVEWMITQCPFDVPPIVKAFVTHSKDPALGATIMGFPVISEDEYMSEWNTLDDHNVFIGVGSPVLKRKIVEKISNQFTHFPNLIHPDVAFDHRAGAVHLGKGIVIFSNATLTTCITLHDFVHLNQGANIGHDTSLGRFTTISPGVSISGNVMIGETVFFGTKSCTVEQISITDYTVIGAGAVVIKSISESGTYVGVPAKKLNK